MLLNLTELSTEPLHIQIIRQLSEKIIDGDLREGVELEPVNLFARSQQVSRNTVQRAYNALAREGLIRTRRSSGFYVAALTPDQKQEIARQRLSGKDSTLSTIESFSKQLISVFDPDKLRQIVEENIKKALLVRSVTFVFYNEQQDVYTFYPCEEFPQPELVDRTDEIFKIITKFKLPVTVKDFQSGSNNCGLSQQLLKRQIELILPLIESDELLGFLGLTAKVDGNAYSKDDLNLLKILLNQFVTALATARFYVEAIERRRMQDDIATAMQIQHDLLPKKLPDEDQISVSAHISSRHAVSGDFYDYLPIDAARFGLVIGDACGSGLSAALLISQIQAILKSEMQRPQNLPAMLNNLNQQLVRFTPKDKFVTLFYGVFNKKSRIFEYVTAGHNHPLVMRKDGTWQWLKVGGPALGVLQPATYATGKIHLRAGDFIFFYTDGVTETMNAQREEYGEPRLLELLKSQTAANSSQIVHSVLQDLTHFAEEIEPQDDRTILVLKIKG